MHQAIGPTEQGRREYKVNNLLIAQSSITQFLHVFRCGLRWRVRELDREIENSLVTLLKFCLTARMKQLFNNIIAFCKLAMARCMYGGAVDAMIDDRGSQRT